jgi:hypothetical protein
MLFKIDYYNVNIGENTKFLASPVFMKLTNMETGKKYEGTLVHYEGAEVCPLVLKDGQFIESRHGTFKKSESIDLNIDADGMPVITMDMIKLA